MPVTRGAATLKEAVDSAFEVYLTNPKDFIYAIGSVVGPHPFPKMVRDFQAIVGREARQQFLDRHGRLPDHVAACVVGVERNRHVHGLPERCRGASGGRGAGR